MNTQITIDTESVHHRPFKGKVLDFGYGSTLDLAALADAIERQDWSKVISLTCIGCGHIDVRAIWSLALTAKYGDGVHESRCDAEGVPTAETLAAFPRIADRMREAGEKITSHHLWRLEKWGRS